MTTIINTEIDGFHEITASYNEEAETVTLETFINLSISKSIKIDEITLTIIICSVCCMRWSERVVTLIIL